MDKKTALVLAKVAGYHNDSALYTRVRIESRVSMNNLHKKWFQGQRAKEAGVKCDCRDCQNNNWSAPE